MKGLAKFLLRILGWKPIYETIPDIKKCLIIGVPHTSAWDFVISWLYYTSDGRTANILIKKEFFIWPIAGVLRRMGGVPIDRSRGANVIRQTIQHINKVDYCHLAVAPEGTRKKTKKWKAGFHMIAKETGIPVYLGSFDWGRKEITVGDPFELTDDASADIKRMKEYYRNKNVRGKFPEMFTTE